jgi:diguanylate cyclase (GGDEF)-like protein
VVLAIGDLNDFKRINDRHGHIAGERCLADVAGVIASHAREGDEVFRWAATSPPCW